MKKIIQILFLFVIFVPWIAFAVDITELPDLGLPATATDKIVTYDSSAPEGDRITGVLFPSDTSQVLSGAGWIDIALNLSGLSDTTFTSLTSGQGLLYNGSYWYNTDVTGSVGDCTGGSCLDGTSDGGEEIALWDGDSNKTTVTASNTSTDIAVVLPATAGVIALTTQALDTFGATTDVTTNNATTAKHGLLPKLSGISTQFLDGDGVFSDPAPAGDVDGVGDCASGACGDGSSDGGTLFRLYNASGGFYTEWQAGASAENLTFKWPTTQGTAGYQLTEDGSGNLYWAGSGTTAYDDIGNPDSSGEITFGAYAGTYTSATDGWPGLVFSNTAADNASDTNLITLEFDDAKYDANSIFLEMTADADGVPFTAFKFAGDGFYIGEETPTITMDGDDAFISDDFEAAGSITAPVYYQVRAAGGDPTFQYFYEDPDETGDNFITVTAPIALSNSTAIFSWPNDKSGAETIAMVSDIVGATGMLADDGDTGTGTYDFGGTTAFEITNSNADPTIQGQIILDTTVTNFTNGAFRFYDGSNIRQSVSMVAATAEGCTDDQVVSYDAVADVFYCKDDSTGSGSLGSNLASSTNDITTNSVDSVIQLAASNGTAEDLDIDLGGEANLVTFSSDTGVSQIRLLGMDLWIGGDDLFMTTNTTGNLLVADGTNYNPVAMSGDVAIDSAGATTIQANSVDASMLSTQYAYSEIPVAWMKDGTSAPATLNDSTRSPFAYRDFDYIADEDLNFIWFVPADFDSVTTAIQFRVYYLITNATGPSATEGVAFGLSGAPAGDNDASNGPKGSVEVVTDDTLTAVQHDVMITSWSGNVTVTGIAAGDVAEMVLIRDVSDAVDDYAQDVGVFMLQIRYVQNPWS